MKKILILAMSCQHEFFVKEENVVKETWAKDIIDGKYENISFMSYRGGYDHNSYSKKESLLKLNVEDDLKYTFKKTYFALSTIWRAFGEYDYVFRTNTSTYINVELLNAFVQQLENDDDIYASDIYSLTEIKAPYPLCLVGRGNGLLLSKKNIEYILKEGIVLLNQTELYDDHAIGCLLNSKWIKEGQDYKSHIKSFYHGWYKCTQTTIENGHKLCKYNNSSQDYEFWKDFITIQIRNYGDLTSFKFRVKEEDKFYELDKIFKGKTNSNIEESIKKNNARSTNYEIFIGSILGYINYNEWLSTNKIALYTYETSHKAADDPEIHKEHKPMIYVDYHYNKNSDLLI